MANELDTLDGVEKSSPAFDPSTFESVFPSRGFDHGLAQKTLDKELILQGEGHDERPSEVRGVKLSIIIS